jgi:hypothetical protein
MLHVTEPVPQSKNHQLACSTRCSRHHEQVDMIGHQHIGNNHLVPDGEVISSAFLILIPIGGVAGLSPATPVLIKYAFNKIYLLVCYGTVKLI